MECNKDQFQGNKPSETSETAESNDSNKILLHFGESDDITTTDISDKCHVSKLATNLNEARRKGSFCDITLLVGAEKYPIKAHRLVLSSALKYFRAMLTTGLKEASQSEVELPKADAHTMEYIIDFAYTGNIKLNNHNIEQVTSAANFFGVSRLLEKCVDYIKKKIDNTNCIEILEFAEHTSIYALKDSTMKYITENAGEIVSKNLEMIDMSTSLLLEIIGNAATSIHEDPAQNEERLFQMAWNVLHSRTNEEWTRFLPKLLKAVHLPQASDHFLSEIARKVEDSKEARSLIEEAKLEKLEIAMIHKATSVEPEINENVIWRMARFKKSGKLSVTCHGLKEGLQGDWYGAPAFISGKAWCLRVGTETRHQLSGPQRNRQRVMVKCLAAYLHCLSDLHDQTVKFNCSLLYPHASSMKSFVLPISFTSLSLESNEASCKRMFTTLDNAASINYPDTNDMEIVVQVSDVDVKDDNDSDIGSDQDSLQVA